MIIEEIPDAPPPELLARALRNRRDFFYLDSGRPEETDRRFFSFIGFEPFLTWQAKGDRIIVESGDAREEFHQEPLAHLRALMGRYRAPGGSLIPFCGGAVGYFGYEFGAQGEGVYASSPDEPSIPDARFGFYDGVIACDLTSGLTFVVANPVAEESSDVILARLREAVSSAADYVMPTDGLGRSDGSLPRALACNLTQEDYFRRVAQIKDYIAAGDVYQVNLAQRFELATADDPYAIYQRLRKIMVAGIGPTLALAWFNLGGQTPQLDQPAQRFTALVWPCSQVAREHPFPGLLYAEVLSGHNLVVYLAQPACR